MILILFPTIKCFNTLVSTEHPNKNTTHRQKAFTEGLMLKKDRLQLQFDELNQRWRKMSDDLARLYENKDLETRPEEQLRLESIIKEKEQKRQEVDTQLQDLETKLKQEEIQDLISKAQQATKNKAYPKAIELWQFIQAKVSENAPENAQASQELSKLQSQLEKQENSKRLITGLIERMAEIQPIFADVVKRLNDPMAEVSIISEQTEKFINNEIDTEQYIKLCQTLIDTPETAETNTNYTALADRINRGEIVLFIGSNLLQEYGQDAAEENQLANSLAEKVGYSAFDGSLSSIAELYQMLPEFGRKSLLSELDKALPSSGADTRIKLYESLAKIDTPLVLISSAYDNLLEQAFLETGKKFAELSSIITRSEEYDIGHVVVRYSDQKEPEKTYIEEELSRLRLLEEGYSLIYKIRGTCKQNPQSDALTLAESNYFTFARYGKKIIPSYLSRQFRDRGFLFLGFSPKSWEDRLLVNTLLKKRQHSPEPCYTIGTAFDKMETAYWVSCNVKEHKAELTELDTHLEKVVLR